MGSATGPRRVIYQADFGCFSVELTTICYPVGMPSITASLPDDPIALKAMVAALQAQNSALSATVRVFEQHIADLQLRIAKLKRQAFGKRSESSARSNNSNSRLKAC
jgi:hypothetical protein